MQRNGERCTVVGTHNYAADGRRTIVVDVTSPDGNETTLTRPLVMIPPPPPPPGKENVRPTGKVFIKKGGKFVPLPNFAQVPLGTELDTRKGKVKLTSHDGSTGDFYEGIFKLGVEKVQRITFTVIVLTGGNFAVCKTSKRKLSAGGKPKPPKSVRHVWGNAKGHFRTKGKYASATVRGTNWLTNDICPGTRVTVRRGSSTCSTSSSASTLPPRREDVPREAEGLSLHVLPREREPEPGNAQPITKNSAAE